VLIDAAPMLGIGDTLVLASKVDAILLVTRLNHLRAPMVTELERALWRSQAKPLGIVITGASAADTYGYAYGYAYPDPGASADEPLPESRPTERHT
jgi:Mrp family chromosome partitioning ATPase